MCILFLNCNWIYFEILNFKSKSKHNKANLILIASFHFNIPKLASFDLSPEQCGTESFSPRQFGE